MMNHHASVKKRSSNAIEMHYVHFCSELPCTPIFSVLALNLRSFYLPPDSKPSETSSSDAAKDSTEGGESVPTSAAGGAAAALFPCLVYYPGSNNYSLIWVPMDGSNPAISQAAGNIMWPGV